MTWVRKGWAGRLCASVLLLSMLLTLMVPSSGAAADGRYGTYERWIREQLRVPVDAAVEQAIAEAVEVDADSFDRFIVAFLDAFAEAAPDRPLSYAFTERELSGEALISYLQRRYSQVAETGVLPRVFFTTPVQTQALGGKFGVPPSRAAEVAIGDLAAGNLATSLSEGAFVLSIRILSSARPLGP